MAITIAAVGLAGMFAAMMVSPVFAFTTAAMMGLLTHAARRQTGIFVPSPSTEFPELPPDARRAVIDSMRKLESGDAKRLLLAVVVQARPLFASRGQLLDADAERATRDNAASLVQACCDTAVELSNLDASRPGASSSVSTRMDATRSQLADRLSRAATALGELYLAGHEHGSPASNRVAELVDEISADARARGAAASELGELLDT